MVVFASHCRDFSRQFAMKLYLDRESFEADATYLQDPRLRNVTPQVEAIYNEGLQRRWCVLVARTVGPLIIESLEAKKRVSTGVLGALDDPPVVQTKI